ncbi:hypothetical protein [Methylobacterium oxalidis]|uniref:hypothetical protein n=1 Tax=Methylobacterium oxalidis TaxID=944322 RepID=UPI0033158685
MVLLRHSWTSELVRVSRAVIACLVVFALAVSIIAPDSHASEGPLHSDGVLLLSSQLALDETGSGEPSDAGFLFHAHCGCHQVMRAEPATFELARIADRVVYAVLVELLASRPASPLRRPPRV